MRRSTGGQFERYKLDKATLEKCNIPSEQVEQLAEKPQQWQQAFIGRAICFNDELVQAEQAMPSTAFYSSCSNRLQYDISRRP